MIPLLLREKGRARDAALRLIPYLRGF